MEEVPAQEAEAEDEFRHTGADAVGRAPLSELREGAVVEGEVVANILYHGAQVGGQGRGPGAQVGCQRQAAGSGCWVPWEQGRGARGSAAQACGPWHGLLPRQRRLRAQPGHAPRHRGGATWSAAPGTTVRGLLSTYQGSVPPPTPPPGQVDIGAAWDGLLPIAEEQWPEVGTSLAPGTRVQLRIHRVRDDQLFRFPIQVGGGRCGRSQRCLLSAASGLGRRPPPPPLPPGRRPATRGIALRAGPSCWIGSFVACTRCLLLFARWQLCRPWRRSEAARRRLRRTAGCRGPSAGGGGDAPRGAQAANGPAGAHNVRDGVFVRGGL